MVITRGTTLTKTGSWCPTICDDTGLNSYSFTVLLFSPLFLLSQWLVHIQCPRQKWQFRSHSSGCSCRPAGQPTAQPVLIQGWMSLIQGSFKMRQLTAKGGKKPLGSCSSFGAPVGRQSPVLLCNSLHKQFEENSLLGCYHCTSLGQKCQYKESWSPLPTGNTSSSLLLVADVSRGRQMKKQV